MSHPLRRSKRSRATNADPSSSHSSGSGSDEDLLQPVLAVAPPAPVDPYVVETLVAEELRYRQQRAVHEQAHAALLAALPPPPPAADATGAPSSAGHDSDDGDGESEDSGDTLSNMARVQQWLQKHSLRELHPPPPPTRAFHAVAPLPRAPPITARLRMALLGPARDPRLLLPLSVDPLPDEQSDALELLFDLLALASEPDVSIGAFISIAMHLFSDGPKLTHRSLQKYLLQWKQRPMVPLRFTSLQILCSFPWRKYLTLYGANSELFLKPEISKLTQGQGAGLLPTENIGAVLSLVGIGAINCPNWLDRDAVLMLVRFLCRMLTDDSLIRCSLPSIAAPVLELLGCCTNAIELAQLCQLHLKALGSRGRQLAAQMCCVTLRQHLDHPQFASIGTAAHLPDHLHAGVGLHPKTLLRVLQLLHENHLQVPIVDYYTLASVVLLVDMLSCVSTFVFLPAERSAYEELSRAASLLNASIRETTLSDPLLSLTKATLVHLSTELASTIASAAKKPTQMQITQFLNKESVKP